MVSEGFFDVLGARPLLGRGFVTEEERPGGPGAVILSHRLWTERFGQDAGVLGRDIVLGDRSYTLAGVMPAGVAVPEWADLWLPLATAGAADVTLTQRGHRVDNRAIARLAQGASAAAAGAEIAAIAARLEAEHPQTNRGLGLRIQPMRELVVGDVRAPLLVMLAAAALVLLIGCANLANLQLARATGRLREMAVRRALGARPGRIARQLLTESLVLAAAGGLLGVALAAALLDVLAALGPPRLPALGVDMPYLAAAGLAGRVLGIVAAVTVLTGLAFGAAPAMMARRGIASAALRGGDVARAPVRARLQSGLAVAQIALAVTLLAGAGLLLRSYTALQRVDPGYEPERLVVLRILPPSRYDDGASRAALYERIADRAEAVAGVRPAALINHMPMTGGLLFADVRVPGVTTAQPRGAAYRTVDEDFFAVAGVPVLRGRALTAADMSAGGGALVVNESFARMLWPDGEALGQSLVVVNPTPGSARFGQPIDGVVVGVVGDTGQPRGGDALPAVYVPHRWDGWGNMYLVLRAAGEPGELVPAVRNAVLSVDDDVPVADAAPMSQMITESLAREALNARLMLAFAALALTLALVGIYGVLSHLVARRTREIGIRMAIGARRTDVIRLFLSHAIRLVALGVATGLPGAIALGRLMRGMLFGVATTDAVTFAAVAMLLGVTALLATWAPAARAGRLDPQIVLRAE
jgi:predicted permease